MRSNPKLGYKRHMTVWVQSVTDTSTLITNDRKLINNHNQHHPMYQLY